MNCPFCSLNSERNRIIRAGDFVTVITISPRLTPGHLLVIPKRHVGKISELREDERQELFATAVEFQERILERIASGCDLTQHYRPFQQQDGIKVDHLHIHLRPRELYDELYEKCQIHERDVFTKPSEEELRAITEALSEKTTIIPGNPPGVSLR